MWEQIVEVNNLKMMVNSGIMKFGQTLYVIFGANIGTTLTAWILSLSGIQSGNVWLKMLKPENFSPILAIIGVVMMMVSNSDKKKSIGTVLVGFTILMYGMVVMSDAVSPLAEMPEFSAILAGLRNPLLGLVVATLFTAVIQSSAASVGFAVEKMRFTPVWASSKLPRTAATATFLPRWVIIWRSCILLTPPSG